MRVEPEMTSGPTSAMMAMIGGGSQRRVMVAGDGGGMRAASAGIGHGGHHVGRAAGSGNAHHHVLARGTPTGDVPLAQFFGVFVDLDG